MEGAHDIDKGINLEHFSLQVYPTKIRTELSLTEPSCLVTDRVRSTREGYVLARVCPSIHPSICPHLGGVPPPGPAGGVPRQERDTPMGVPHLGYPHQTWPGGTPTGGYPTSGTPLSDLAGGYPDGGVPHLGYPPRPGLTVPHLE